MQPRPWAWLAKNKPWGHNNILKLGGVVVVDLGATAKCKIWVAALKTSGAITSRDNTIFKSLESGNGQFVSDYVLGGGKQACKGEECQNSPDNPNSVSRNAMVAPQHAVSPWQAFSPTVTPAALECAKCKMKEDDEWVWIVCVYYQRMNFNLTSKSEARPNT